MIVKLFLTSIFSGLYLIHIYILKPTSSCGGEIVLKLRSLYFYSFRFITVTFIKINNFRNRRMFGALLGTLQKFRQEETRLKDRVSGLWILKIKCTVV